MVLLKLKNEISTLLRIRIFFKRVHRHFVLRSSQEGALEKFLSSIELTGNSPEIIFEKTDICQAKDALIPIIKFLGV